MKLKTPSLSLGTMLELAGSALAITGTWQIYRPLAYLVGAVLCFWGSYALALTTHYLELDRRAQSPRPAARARQRLDQFDDGDQELAEPEQAEVIPDHVRLTKGGLVRP